MLWCGCNVNPLPATLAQVRQVYAREGLHRLQGGSDEVRESLRRKSDMESSNSQQTPSQPTPAKKLTPSAIVHFLDQYVVGQDEAKKTLSVAVYSHYRKIGKQRSAGAENVKPISC